MKQPEAATRVFRDLWIARLARGKTGRLVVRSGSMAPLLQLGDEVIVAQRPNRILPSNLVVFRQEDRLICHRIMLPYAPRRYLQKGDFNREWEKVAEADIIGAPKQVIIGKQVIPLEGPRFRFWNTLLWLVVAARDLGRQICRIIPRLSWPCERLFSRPILAIIRRIRQRGGYRWPH
jgi:hypothetical protein